MAFTDLAARLADYVAAAPGLQALSVVTVLPTDFLEHLPLAHVRITGGIQDEVDRVSRLSVDVYADAPTSADAPTAGSWAEQLVDLLAPGPLFLGDDGLVDEVAIETIPVQMPFSDRVDLAPLVLSLTHRDIYS